MGAELPLRTVRGVGAMGSDRAYGTPRRRVLDLSGCCRRGAAMALGAASHRDVAGRACSRVLYRSLGSGDLGCRAVGLRARRGGCGWRSTDRHCLDLQFASGAAVRRRIAARRGADRYHQVASGCRLLGRAEQPFGGVLHRPNIHRLLVPRRPTVERRCEYGFPFCSGLLRVAFESSTRPCSRSADRARGGSSVTRRGGSVVSGQRVDTPASI